MTIYIFTFRHTSLMGFPIWSVVLGFCSQVLLDSWILGKGPSLNSVKNLTFKMREEDLLNPYIPPYRLSNLLLADQDILTDFQTRLATSFYATQNFKYKLNRYRVLDLYLPSTISRSFGSLR